MTEFLTGFSWGVGFGILCAIMLSVFRSIQEVPEGAE